MLTDDILIRGAKEHNLKNIDVRLPRFKLIVITGVSGSGKSSLAFDTLYAEGQRRYVESLSAYARQFIAQMDKPRVDYIEGLSPAIAIEQKSVSRNPRSTVGTVTEIYDYLRVLFARVGTPHCPNCAREVRAQSPQEIVDQIVSLPPATRFQVLAPIARNQKGTFQDLLRHARADGFARVRIDGQVISLGDKIRIDKNKKHNIEIVIDRLTIPRDVNEEPSSSFLSRLTDSVETALKAGEGLLLIEKDHGEEWLLSEQNACPKCNLSFPSLSPAMFSFNSPLGMCQACNGLGTKAEFDPDRFVDPDKSLHEGGVLTWRELGKKTHSGTYKIVKQIVEQFEHDLDTPWKDLSPACQHAILYGGTTVRWQSKNARANWQGEWTYEGTLNETRRRYRQTKSEHTRKWYASFMSQQPCSECNGLRLRPESSAVIVGGKNINEVTAFSIDEARTWIEALGSASDSDGSTTLSPTKLEIADEILKEIHGRLQFLMNVGLHYLTLDRSAPTLSGGEGQRIRLASQIGCGLVGVLYVLDEPSIGLHQRDNRRLLDMLERLRDIGNTVLIVEHDEETIRTADWVVDLGPGAGIKGGEVVAAGSPRDILNNPNSVTGRYLSRQLTIATQNKRRKTTNGKWLTIVGARQNNLKNLTVRIPLGLFTCVTGVSGSGKSSLIAQTLYPALSSALHRSEQKPGRHDRLEGISSVDKVINITQDPIGRTPRSNPATYVQLMSHIRDLFALTTEAKVRGYKSGRFSFNVKGGRCEACKGYGKRKVEMHFLPDIWVMCPVCKGKRFNRETLQIRFGRQKSGGDKNIADLLDMDVAEALDFFSFIPKIKHILKTLVDVGLGYIKLGQSATTLSGGEAQRIKLARELARLSTGDTVYILDEPTTGLHFADVQNLLDVLHRLTDAGNTVIVIEHNLDVIKTADWIIDLGPEGGQNGGYIVAEGTPDDIALSDNSFTGHFLGKTLSEESA